MDIATSFAEGALTNVSHIDIKYEAEEPFRIRLISGSGLSMQVLLAGVGGERIARIRMKDFRPDPYADANGILSQGFVDENYLAQVNGISIENAATTGNLTYNVKIKRIIFHGMSAEDL